MKQDNQAVKRQNLRLRLNVHPDHPDGIILRYYQDVPKEVKDSILELFRKANTVVALKSLSDKGELYVDRPQPDDQFLQQFIQSEAWQSMGFLWGLIESICAAAEIDSNEVVTRFTGGGAYRGVPAARERNPISDAAKVEEAAGAEPKDEGAGLQHREEIPSLFQN